MKVEVFTSDDQGNRSKQVRKAGVTEVTWNLNGIHEAAFGLHPLDEDAGLVQLNVGEIAVVFYDDDGSIITVWQGVARTFDGSLDALGFHCEHIASYLMQAYVTTVDLVYNDVDQHTIGWNLVQYAQSLADQDRNIVAAAFAPSGVSRTRRYLKEEYPNIFEQLHKFPGLESGYEWDVVVLPDGRREWTPYFPNKGSLKSQYALELDRKGRKFITGLQVRGDGYNHATDIYVTGATDQATQQKLVGRWTADAQRLTDYGRIQKVLSEGNDESQTWLDNRAAGEGEVAQDPITLPTIHVSHELFGKVWHGDTLPMRVDYGYYQLNGNYRITQLKWLPQSLALQVQEA